jgi:radical SAM-linked protein
MKIRARFTKLGRVRFTSHRDVARMWERALRQVHAPIAYTAGFSPRPQLSFGLALPTGCESDAEYLDIALTESLDPAGLARATSDALPEGIDVVAATVLVPGVRSLQEDVTLCTWEITVPGAGAGQLEDAVGRTLCAEHIELTRERKGRSVVDDIRPAVHALWCAPNADGDVVLVAELATQPRGIRPTELSEALGLTFGVARRTCQWIEHDGSRHDPLVAQPAGAVVVGMGAS